MSVALRAGQQEVSRQWQPGPPGGGECVCRGCGGPRLCVSQGAMKVWKLGSSVGSVSVLVLLMWSCGGDRSGTPGGPGGNRKGQVGETASWKGLSCFPWGEGGTRRVCRSRLPAWLPELAIVVILPSAPIQGLLPQLRNPSNQSAVLLDALCPKLQDWPVLFWTWSRHRSMHCGAGPQRMGPAGPPLVCKALLCQTHAAPATLKVTQC